MRVRFGRDLAFEGKCSSRFVHRAAPKVRGEEDHLVHGKARDRTVVRRVPDLRGTRGE